MRFFKEIKDEKLANRDFYAIYKKECHLCAFTLKVISLAEAHNEQLDNILKILNISTQCYDALKSGDHCQPKQVQKLCNYFKIDDTDLVSNCPRLY